MDAYSDGFILTGEVVGRTDNIRISIQSPFGLGAVSYSNCEGTDLLRNILINSE